MSIAKELIISDYDYIMDFLVLTNLILLLSAVFYLLVHLGLAAGIKRCNYAKNNAQPFISIIVAARNEERNIGKLIQSLLHQTYANYEIIIVNDRSKDKTINIIEDYRRMNSKIICIDIQSLSDEMPAKKNALRAAIDASKGEILCFTDADCIPPQAWIENVVSLFDDEVGLIAGYSPYRIPFDMFSFFELLKRTFFRFVAYEELRAAIWSAGSIGWNLAWLCTGRNLAYRRKVYHEVEGFEKIKMSISGDDDLFLQLVRKCTKWKIRYMLSKESFVTTEPPSNLGAFIEQRKRHFSAAKYFSFPMKLFFFFYHLSNIILFTSPILYFMNYLTLSSVIICICIKLSSDALIINSSVKEYNGTTFRRSFILMEALYVFYNVLIGPLGLFRSFEWKQK